MEETDLLLQFPGSTLTKQAREGEIILTLTLENGRERHVAVKQELLTQRPKELGRACAHLAQWASET